MFSNYTGSVGAQAYVTTGFANYPNVDPAVVADTDATEIVDGGAVAGLALVGAGFSVPSIPSPPKNANVLTTGAPDPDLSLPSLVTARGGVVSVPVMLDSAMPAGSTGLTEATLAMTFDPHVLSVADVRLGSLPALGTGWTVTSVVDAAGGQLAIELYSPTPLDVAAAGSLVQVDFDVLPGAVGSTTVNLVGAVDPNGGRWFSTNLADSQGAMAPGASTAAAGFKTVNAYFKHGGTDTANLTGTAGSDTASLWSTSTLMKMGTGNTVRAWYFARYNLDGRGGSGDTAPTMDAPVLPTKQTDVAGARIVAWAADFAEINQDYSPGSQTTNKSYAIVVDELLTAYWS